MQFGREMEETKPIGTACQTGRFCTEVNFIITRGAALAMLASKHYKMSNENFKHHENRGKVDGGLTCTFQGTLFLILLCKVNGGVEFENHIFVRICNENCTHLTLQTMFISDEKPKK